MLHTVHPPHGGERITDSAARSAQRAAWLRPTVEVVTGEGEGGRGGGGGEAKNVMRSGEDMVVGGESVEGVR